MIIVVVVVIIVVIVIIIAVIVTGPARFGQKFQPIDGCDAHDGDPSVHVDTRLGNRHAGDLELTADLNLAES